MTDSILILITFLITAGILGFFFFLWLKKSKTDQVQTEAIKDLERRLTDLMINQLKEIRGTVDGTSRQMSNQVRSFTKETIQLRENLKQIQEKVKNISSFQEIFRSPKLRGQWGEASLDHILSQFFPSELYKHQYLFSSGERVDAILKLPNGKILPIDSKFSSENFERMIKTENDDEEEIFRQKFFRDVKSRIEEISSKYILPAEGTVDFALMYIPAEAIYYEIIFNLQKKDITNFAWKKKVVLTSPNTIYLTLRTIEHWFKDTQISKQTQEIFKRLGRIYQDAEKLSDNFRKLGRHLRNAGSAYDNSERKLSLLGERVEKIVEIGEKKQLKESKKIKK